MPCARAVWVRDCRLISLRSVARGKDALLPNGHDGWMTQLWIFASVLLTTVILKVRL